MRCTASPDPERLGHLQNTHTLREQPSHLPFGHAVDLRAAEPVTSPLGFDCSINAYNTYSMRRAGKVYPHESDIQETHTKHHKLDSQAALPHPTRDRAADGPKYGRYGHRDATMILVAYRHG